MIAACRRISASVPFQNVIVGVIVANAVILGLETSPPTVQSVGGWLLALDWIIQAIFVGELAIRILAHWPRPAAFFRSGWNVFDFVVVAVALLPASGSFATVGRLLRLLRVTRLISVFPQLRLIINTMLLSIPSMGHVVLLLSLLLYVYGIAGVYLFREADPTHWGTLGASLLSLFQVVTLEGWAELQGAVIPERPWAWVYFASFIILAVFVVINLFIAVVVNNLEKAKEQERRDALPDSSASDLLLRVETLRKQIDELDSALRRDAAREVRQ